MGHQCKFTKKQSYNTNVYLYISILIFTSGDKLYPVDGRFSFLDLPAVMISWLSCARSRITLTCDQASLLFCGRKVRLIQLLDYLSVASPESGLFSDWSRNKRYLELSHNWFSVWQCDFRSKKSPELMNSITTSDEASEESKFLSALNASLESFVHNALKDIHIECIHRIVCHGRDVLSVQPTPHQKPPQNTLFLLAYKVEQYLHQATH